MMMITNPFPEDLLDALAPTTAPPPPAHDAHLIPLPSGKLHIESSEPKKVNSRTETIILVHSIGSTCRIFDPLVYHSGLRNKHKVVVFDLEGHGQSPFSPDKGYGADKWAKMIGEVADWAGAEKITIIAHSFGCYLASLFACDKPDRVSKLFFINPVTACSANNSDLGKTTKLIEAILARGTEPMVEHLSGGGSFNMEPVYPLRLNKRGTPQQSLAKAFVTSAIEATRPQTLALYLAESWGRKPNYSKLGLGEGKVRMMTMNGEFDGLVSDAMKAELQEELKGAYFFPVQKSGHYTLVDDIPALQEILEGFIM